MKCFIDMDGVLVNFIDAAHKLHGQDVMLPEWPYEMGPGSFQVESRLGISVARFFRDMDREFWANLDWFEFSNDDWRFSGELLLGEMERRYGQENICILTSPCLTPGCVEGKRDWINKYIPQYNRQVLFGSCKEFCAGPNSILYAAKDSNIEAFQSRCGQGVLVPRPWNSMCGEWVCHQMS